MVQPDNRRLVTEARFDQAGGVPELDGSAQVKQAQLPTHLTTTALNQRIDDQFDGELAQRGLPVDEAALTAQIAQWMYVRPDMAGADPSAAAADNLAALNAAVIPEDLAEGLVIEVARPGTYQISAPWNVNRSNCLIILRPGVNIEMDVGPTAIGGAFNLAYGAAFGSPDNDGQIHNVGLMGGGRITARDPANNAVSFGRCANAFCEDMELWSERYAFTAQNGLDGLRVENNTALMSGAAGFSVLAAAIFLTTQLDAGDATINVNNTNLFPDTGSLDIGPYVVTYTGRTATSFTGVTWPVGATGTWYVQTQTPIAARLSTDLLIRGNRVVETVRGGQQRITIHGSPAGGTWTITCNGSTTAGLAHDATWSQVQTALRALPGCSKITVWLDGNGDYVVTIPAPIPHDPLVIDHSALTGGASPYIAVEDILTGKGFDFAYFDGLTVEGNQANNTAGRAFSMAGNPGAMSKRLTGSNNQAKNARKNPVRVEYVKGVRGDLVQATAPDLALAGLSAEGAVVQNCTSVDASLAVADVSVGSSLASRGNTGACRLRASIDNQLAAAVASALFVDTVYGPAPRIPTWLATGGTLAAGTYYYRVTALDGVGESLASGDTVSVATVGSTSSIRLTWTPSNGAIGYRVYRSTASNMASATMYEVTGGLTNRIIDTGAAGTSQQPPSLSTCADPDHAYELMMGPGKHLYVCSNPVVIGLVTGRIRSGTAGVFASLTEALGGAALIIDGTPNPHMTNPGATAPTAAAQAALGSSPPAPTVVGNDSIGAVTYGTGTSPTTGPMLTVTFAKAWSTPPVVFVQQGAGTSSARALTVSSVTTVGFTINCGVAHAASTSGLTLSYQCIGTAP